MDSELQDSPDAAAGFDFEFGEGVEVPGIEDDGLFADGVRTAAEGEADMRVVQMIGRTDAQIIDTVLFGSAAQLIQMAVETLELPEIAHLREVAVQYAHRVMRIGHGHKRVASFLYRLEMAGRYVAGDAGECEV